MNDGTITPSGTTTKPQPGTGLAHTANGAIDTSPPAVLARLLAQNTPITDLKELMALQERWEQNEARKAFNVAFANFKAEAINVTKNTLITDGPLKGKHHLSLFGLVNAVTPHLSTHGLSISWRLTKDEPAWMEVTCTLRHVGGHSESVSMGAAPDTGPGRNAIQARGSSKSYLERYTATAILGLAAADSDDDGAGGKKAAVVTEAQVKQLRALIVSMRANKAGQSEVEVGLCKYLKVDKLEELPAKAFNEALSSLQKKKRLEDKAKEKAA